MLIVAFFTGGAWSAWNGDGDGILVLFAGLSLLFRSRYPRSALRLRLGLNRWVIRVIAYAFG